MFKIQNLSAKSFKKVDRYGILFIKSVVAILAKSPKSFIENIFGTNNDCNKTELTYTFAFLFKIHSKDTKIRSLFITYKIDNLPTIV